MLYILNWGEGGGAENFIIRQLVDILNNKIHLIPWHAALDNANDRPTNLCDKIKKTVSAAIKQLLKSFCTSNGWVAD